MHGEGGRSETPRERFGAIDVYLFDQILKGRIPDHARVLDAGCGRGRNLFWLLRRGVEVWAVDADPAAVEATRALASELGAPVGEDRLRVADIDGLPFPDASFDFVISSAVLHFSRDEAHFRACVEEMGRVLAPRGVLFARLASTVGLEGAAAPLHGRWHRLPDGTDRFLVDEPLLLEMTERLGGRLLDPLKTTLVHGQRSMTTWVVRKG